MMKIQRTCGAFARCPCRNFFPAHLYCLTMKTCTSACGTLPTTGAQRNATRQLAQHPDLRWLREYGEGLLDRSARERPKCLSGYRARDGAASARVEDQVGSSLGEDIPADLEGAGLGLRSNSGKTHPLLSSATVLFAWVRSLLSPSGPSGS